MHINLVDFNNLLQKLKRISHAVVWKIYTQIKLQLNFAFWNSATSYRTSLGCGSQNGYFTNQQAAPPKVGI